jgi:hypothetical protein|nr:MAG TPA: hypothetical protein [Caudoviricetes sp.]
MNKEKELNILEAIEMPIGTEFKVYKYTKDRGFDKCNTFTNVYLNENKDICWCGTNEEMPFMFNSTIKAKFIPIQKPISFQEAYYQNKLLILEISEDIKKYLAESVDDKYRTMEEIVSILRKTLSNKALLIALFEGKWYAKI